MAWEDVKQKTFNEALMMAGLGMLAANKPRHWTQGPVGFGELVGAAGQPALQHIMATRREQEELARQQQEAAAEEQRRGSRVQTVVRGPDGQLHVLKQSGQWEKGPMIGAATGKKWELDPNNPGIQISPEGKRVAVPGYKGSSGGGGLGAGLTAVAKALSERRDRKDAEKWGSERGEAAAEQEKKMYQSSYEALGTVNDYDVLLDQIDKGLATGAMAPLISTAGAILESVGVNSEWVEQAKRAQSFTAVSNKIATSLIGGEGGVPANNFSNADMIFVREQAPRLQNTPGANRAIIALGRLKAQRQIEKAQAWEAYQNERNNDVSSNDWRRFNAQWLKYNSSEERRNEVRAIFESALQTTGPSKSGSDDAEAKALEAENAALMKELGLNK